jgi:hypothetical protein
LNLKGGEIGIPPDNWKSWILTVINNLQPTHKVLLPIYKIVADGPKRENIKRKIKESHWKDLIRNEPKLIILN